MWLKPRNGWFFSAWHSSSIYGKMDIDNLIETASWRDIIQEVVRSMDPWDVDIAELAARYSTHLEQMQKMEFRVPANVVIVSSVLLRMKADMMAHYGSIHEDQVDYGYDIDGMFDLTQEDSVVNGTEDLFLLPTRQPKRRITALELINAIQDALADTRVTRGVRKKITEHKDILVNLEADIRQVIDDIYSRIVKALAKKEVVAFSDILKSGNSDEIISVFVPLLHLSNDQKIRLVQEEMFGEIFIRQV